MDAREAAIALAGSRNAAVELVANRIIDLGASDVTGIAAGIAELTTKLHEAYLPQLQAALNMAAAPAGAPVAAVPAPAVPGPTAQAVQQVVQAMPGSQPVNLPSPPKNYQYDGRECPVCVQNGRNGAMLQNTDPSFKGPEFKCHLVKREKRGTEFVDVGACNYQEWGRNARS